MAGCRLNAIDLILNAIDRLRAHYMLAMSPWGQFRPISCGNQRVREHLINVAD